MTDKYNEIANADVVILPGVGHFKDAMQAINERGLANIITSITDKPVIGICLGMQ
ncbi:imidazole glycerol phosphate synthase subunit HisH, partial [Staphylococcus epidermidis]|uniref:glutamine amidotransferase-related protein n=1 Tax=Staphylococcus epidermidis TaxID=1282 RepID=UPI0030C3B6C2